MINHQDNWSHSIGFNSPHSLCNEILLRSIAWRYTNKVLRYTASNMLRRRSCCLERSCFKRTYSLELSPITIYKWYCKEAKRKNFKEITAGVSLVKEALLRTTFLGNWLWRFEHMKWWMTIRNIIKIQTNKKTIISSLNKQTTFCYSTNLCTSSPEWFSL